MTPSQPDSGAASARGFDDPARLDPLGADRLVARVPAMNAAADVGGLLAALEAITPTPQWVGAMRPGEHLAAMRDLSLVITALGRHGIDPLPDRPWLEATLLDLGVRTGLPPRDTVQHHADWNPLGERQRLQTGGHFEHVYLDGLRRCSGQLGYALGLLTSLEQAEPDDPVWGTTLRAAGHAVASLAALVGSVTAAAAAPGWVLAPYARPITVGGVAYRAPAPGDLPLGPLEDALQALGRRGGAGHLAVLGDPVRLLRESRVSGRDAEVTAA